MRTMTRWVLTGFMALGAVAVLDIGSTAEAAPSVSPFAGTYYAVGHPPVTISDGGRITAFSDYGGSTVSINGRVGADGRYSFTATVTTYSDHPGLRDTTSRYRYAGTMAPDADGNLVVTEDTGGSSVWLRQ